jgi:hypothetical protein
MRRALRVIRISLGGGIGTAALWWIVNWWIVAVMGEPGFEQRWWPLSSIWACTTIGAVFYAILGTADTVVKSRAQRRRAHHAEQVTALAAELKFDYVSGICSNDLIRYRNLSLFRLSRWSEAVNRMTGQFDGLDVELVDYTYVLKGDEGGESHYSQTVVLFPNCAANLPRFQLNPSGPVSKFLYGDQGISFEVDERMVSLDRDVITLFSNQYFLCPGKRPFEDVVRGTHDSSDDCESAIDKESVQRLFNLELLRFFAGRPGWSVESDGQHLAVWRTKHIVPADKRRRFLDDAVRVRRAIIASSASSSRSQVVQGEVKVAPRTARWSRAPGIGMLVGFVVGALLGMAIVGTWVASVEDPPMVPVFIVFFGLPHIGLFIGHRVGYWLSRRKH